ncbi:hypothetical protein DXG03_001441 [Asterophora parasitica]|uniref:Uncharacterized protein n=1 Tax=Asterophora parasitica TaxID=117018 RepID=A0A9P7KGQ2_9AGAR|nr:hypothetical protein DXG03_001441 [Asterophora parasitica]
MQSKGSTACEPAYFVKYGDEDDISAEAKTQIYIHNLAQQDGSAPRSTTSSATPEGPAFWSWSHTLETVDSSEAVAFAASAVRWLITQQPPSFAFDGMRRALQAFVNTALSRTPPAGRLSPISFESTPRVIYHSDIKKDNFLVDADHRVWMIDFQHVGVLPLPFQQFAFYNTNAFAAAVGRALNVEKMAPQGIHETEAIPSAATSTDQSTAVVSDLKPPWLQQRAPSRKRAHTLSDDVDESDEGFLGETRKSRRLFERPK